MTRECFNNIASESRRNLKISNVCQPSTINDHPTIEHLQVFCWLRITIETMEANNKQPGEKPQIGLCSSTPSKSGSLPFEEYREQEQTISSQRFSKSNSNEKEDLSILDNALNVHSMHQFEERPKYETFCQQARKVNGRSTRYNASMP
jgi:hypothetical protein